MNAGIENKELNAGAPAPEGVMDGTPEITEENLFELVDSGAISIDKANEWIAEQEKSRESAQTVEADPIADVGINKEVDVVPENNIEPDVGGVVPEGNKPFRVYNTQEEFQQDFDKAWGKRYGKQKEEAERKDAEHNALLSDLADLLGVAPSDAADELRRRRLTSAAERQGKNPADFIETENLRAENARLKESEEKRKAAEIVSEINAQGAEIQKTDPTFNINEAMNNPEFARQVFFTRQTNPERAVDIAYKIFYQDKVAAAPSGVHTTAPAVARPQEGAATAATTGARKPVDYSKMSSADMRAMDKKIMRGEKIEI